VIVQKHAIAIALSVIALIVNTKCAQTLLNSSWVNLGNWQKDFIIKVM
jgi:hypothetical protein